MGDIKPNLNLHSKRLSVHISEMKLQIERLELRKFEIQDELNKIDENIKASLLDIEKTQEQIDNLGK